MPESLLLRGKGHFRTDDRPLEEMRIFADLVAAREYARTHPRAAPGQILTVTGATATDAYLIQFDKTLKPVGSGGAVTSVNHIGPDTSGNVELDAWNVPFDEAGFTNTGDALASLLYVRPAVTLTGGGTCEIGQTVTSVALNWAITGSKPVTSQSLNQGIGDITPLTLRTYTHSGQTITANRTYTITVSDGWNTAAANTTVAFSPKRYWGVSDKETLTDADILALASEFSANRTQSRVLDCTGGRYFYFVWESSYGAGLFNVNGLANNAFTQVTRNMVNASGAVRNVIITRSNNLLFGNAYTVAVT